MPQKINTSLQQHKNQGCSRCERVLEGPGLSRQFPTEVLLLPESSERKHGCLAPHVTLWPAGLVELGRVHVLYALARHHLQQRRRVVEVCRCQKARFAAMASNGSKECTYFGGHQTLESLALHVASVVWRWRRQTRNMTNSSWFNKSKTALTSRFRARCHRSQQCTHRSLGENIPMHFPPHLKSTRS